MACSAEIAQANGRKGGRPVGSLGITIKLSRKNAATISKSNKSPLMTMWRNMIFWADKTEQLTERVQRLIVNAENEEERAEAFRLLREMLACREKSQDCAVDLAPYCHPKLQSIAFKNEDQADTIADEVPLDQVEASQVYQRLMLSGP